jgi:hypothetical protein
VIYTAAPIFLPGAFEPLPTRIDVIPGHQTVPVPPPARIKTPGRPLFRREGKPHGNISGLVAYVETAEKRNNALYWAACRVAENPDLDRVAAAAELVEAAVRAGLSIKEATATVRSGLRGGTHV